MSNILQLHHNPFIDDIEIPVDEYGRVSLNALHKAAGGENSKRPSLWLANNQTKELIEELSRNSCLGHDVISIQKGGSNPGTYADKLLAISYAGWISPVFHLKVNQVFYDVQTSSIPLPQPSRVMLSQDAVEMLECELNAAKLLGTKTPMARVIAVDEVKKNTGIDYNRYLIDNQVDQEEIPVTPKELGKELDITSQKVNKRLVAAGLQEKDESNNWIPTDKAEKYCSFEPYKSAHTTHTGYRLLWFRSVLELIKDEIEEAAC